MPFAWVNIPVFDYKGTLRSDENKKLYMWPLTDDDILSDEQVNPIGKWWRTMVCDMGILFQSYYAYCWHFGMMNFGLFFQPKIGHNCHYSFWGCLLTDVMSVHHWNCVTDLWQIGNWVKKSPPWFGYPEFPLIVPLLLLLHCSWI